MNPKHRMLLDRLIWEAMRALEVLIIVAIIGMVGVVIFGHPRAEAQTPAPRMVPSECRPSMVETSLVASPLYANLSHNGCWAWWHCYLPEFSPRFPNAIQTIVFVGTPAQCATAGAKLMTIAKAADPLKSLNDAGKRFTILPLTDPSLTAVVADMRADRTDRK